MNSRYFTTVRYLAGALTRRFLRDRTALFFTIVFPLIFLVIFGSLFGRNKVSFNVAVINQSNTQFSNQFVSIIDKSPLFKVNSTDSLNTSQTKLSQSQIQAILVLPKTFGEVKNGIPNGNLAVYYNQSDLQTAKTLESTINGLVSGINATLTKYKPPITITTVKQTAHVQSAFDYIFSGMLGFTIVILGLLGPSRSIPEFKQKGILRRYHTTPISSKQYILGSLLSGIRIGVLAIVIMFFVGFQFYHLKVYGNYLNLAVFIILSIILMYGFGLAIGGWSKSEERAAPLTNLISFPMMFLSGTFFPTYLMPEWLQKIAAYLPLTPVINGLRGIISGNKNLAQLGSELILMAIWLIIIYAIAFRVFRWE